VESAASRWHLSSLCFAFLIGRCRVTRKSKSTPLTRYSYHERDYAFGRAMPKLRTSLGLTQAGLAALLRVSRRAVGEWEGGLNYPKPEHLQHFLGLCVRASVFAPGRHARLEGRPVFYKEGSDGKEDAT
jgi:DNA-binding XRE family transcriptional regulator